MSVSDNLPPGADDEYVDQIGKHARRGLTWGIAGNIATKAGTFVVGLVMARLISPDHFGVFAVALAAMTFAVHVNDAGIFAACIQWRGKIEDMAPTASTIALGSSVLVYLALFLAAPAFASLSGVPEATTPVRVLCAAILIDGIASVRMAALNRRFQQDLQAKATVAGTVAYAAVALPLGFLGAGTYALVFATLAQWAVLDGLVFKMAALPIRLGFDRSIARQLFKFGLPLAASSGLEAIFMNADFVIVGNVLGAAAAGYYLLAFNISSWAPGLVSTAVKYVAIPGFSRLAEQGTHALQDGVNRTVPVLIATVLPIAVMMITLDRQLIQVAYGDKWDASAVALTYLAVLMVVRMLAYFAMDIVTSAGRTRAAMILMVGWGAALIPALYVGTTMDGIRGTAIAHALVGLFVALPLTVLILRLAQVSLVPTLPKLVRPAIAAVITGVITWYVSRHVSSNALVELIVAGGIGMIAYVLMVVPLATLRRLGGRLARRERNT